MLFRSGRTPSKKDYANAMDLLAEFELDHLANRSCNKLSGGQLQMVLIARALAKDPSILIMDEPESHLDMKNQLKVLGIVETLSHVKNITVVINTHFPAHALRCADKTLLLGGANRYSFGSTKNVINSKTIETFFDTHAKVVHVEKEGKKFCGIIPMEIVQAKGDKITDE